MTPQQERNPTQEMTAVTKSAPSTTRRSGCSIATHPQPHTATADKRHLFITDAIMHGMPPHIAQLVAGHRDINTTMGYKNPRELHQTGVTTVALRGLAA